MTSSIAQFFRLCVARARGVTIAPGVQLGARLDFSLRWDRTARRGTIEIGRGSRIETGAVLHAFSGRIRLGENVFLGPHSVIYGHGGVEIGNDTLVSMHCSLLSSEHTIPPAEQKIRYMPDILKPTRLGADVWLGAGTTVLGGVTIGDGCVIGAGSVVTKDIPPGVVAYGAPARVVRKR